VRILCFLAAAACLLAPAAASAAKSKPKTTHTTAGTAAAERALIGTSDLGPGWVAGTAATSDESLSCGGTSSAVAGVVEIGAAASPTFRESESGPFVSQAAFVYGSDSEADALWEHVAGAKVLACLAKSVAGGGAKGISFTVLRHQELSRPTGDARSSAYRVIVQAKTKAQKVTAYVDMLLLGRGDAVTALSFASFSQPVDTALELSLARVAAGRLA
jgi:hypothetical protein